LLQLAIDWQIMVQISVAEDQIHVAMAEGTVVAVSDGLLKHNEGACIWIIENRMDKDRITGLIRITPGAASEHSSFGSNAVDSLD